MSGGLRLTEEQYADILSRRDPLQRCIVEHGFKGGKVPEKKPRKVASTTGPNKTEAEYGRMLALEFPCGTVRYEAITITMSNGHRYTADWVVYYLNGEGVFLVEVKARGKNGFRHPSYQRAKLAFDQCRQEFSCFRFRWAEKQAGKWDVQDF